MVSVRQFQHPAEPVDMFAQWAGEEGALFLDSSLPGPGGSVSILLRQPEEILTGSLLEDPERLRAWLRQHQQEASPDLGIPLGGAFGQVDYDGQYRFGLYRQLLAYAHETETWTDVNGLREQMAFPDPDEPTLKALPEFSPDLGKAEFCTMVEAAREYIAAGDIYQVNLSHRFSMPWPEAVSPWQFHQALRESSPAPYAAWLNLGGRQISSSSPELFLRMSGRGIQTRPIKGTRPRFRDPEADERSAYELIRSAKENAELIMITDLQRNDLGQICEFGSVRAKELLKLERYEHVFHLVSTVEGLLRPDVDHVSALQACFPGGSITGAPKKRAMEIIEELEPVSRGAYTGAIGYFGLNGDSQFNIAIRTAVHEAGTLHFHTGAGIVTDSDPQKEYEETLHKARGMMKAAELLQQPKRTPLVTQTIPPEGGTTNA